MAKKDNDQTPIQFSDPQGTKGPRIPIPVNQRSWIHKGKASSKSSAGIWGVLFIPIVLSILLISESMYDSPLWLLVILFVAGTILYAHSTANGNSDEMQDNNESNLNRPKKKEKKIPKHRKNYK